MTNHSDFVLSRIAAAIGEPARVRILYCLMGGRARTSTELAAVAGVSPSTASAHLNQLRDVHLLKVVPRGKYQILVCTGTTCHVRGAATVVERLGQQLGIERGETTKDGLFSLQTARCIGACALAPAITIGDDVYGKLTPDRIPRFCQKELKKYA